MPRLPFPHAAPSQIEEQERIKDIQAAVLPFDRIETGDLYPDDFLDVLDGMRWTLSPVVCEPPISPEASPAATIAWTLPLPAAFA